MIEPLEPRIAPAAFVITSLNDAGPGTLRDAIAAANAAPGADVITFQKGLTGLIDLTSGQMAITGPLTIKGPGAAKLGLDAGGLSGIFFVFDGDNAKDSPLRVSGLSFSGGKLSPVGEGGAMEVSESLKVQGCVFRGNEAVQGGGAISFFQNPTGVPIDLDVRDSSFTFNVAGSGLGGAISTSSTGSVTLKNNVFANNVAGGGGALGVFIVPGEVLLIQNCRFLGNSAEDAGAAALFGESAGGVDSTILIRDSLFADNHATDLSAGAVDFFGGKIILERASFIQNTANHDGGGVEASGYSSLLIKSSKFLDNATLTTGFSGGGLHLDVDTPSEDRVTRILGSIIAGNTAAGGGGGIFINGEHGRVEITGSTISNNRAQSDGGGILVGAIIDQSADVRILKSKIVANISVAGAGGGVFAFGDGEFTLQSSTVTGNRSDLGGGVALFKTTPVTILSSVIAQNVATDGGGIYSDKDLELRNTKVLGNFASSFGGGVAATARLVVDGCTISGNFAVNGGGIFQISTESLLVTKSKVTGNFSSDGQQIVDA